MSGQILFYPGVVLALIKGISDELQVQVNGIPRKLLLNTRVAGCKLTENDPVEVKLNRNKGYHAIGVSHVKCLSCPFSEPKQGDRCNVFFRR